MCLEVRLQNKPPEVILPEQPSCLILSNGVSLNVARWHNLKLGNFEFVDESLRLGDLRGNFFQVLMRGAKPDDANAVLYSTVL